MRSGLVRIYIMPELLHPLKVWMRGKGWKLTDYELVSGAIPSKPAPESIRQIANGYRAPGWDLAFEIESITGISAHELRDPKWYGKAA